jgi:hypothetical protein
MSLWVYGFAWVSDFNRVLSSSYVIEWMIDVESFHSDFFFKNIVHYKEFLFNGSLFYEFTAHEHRLFLFVHLK